MIVSASTTLFDATGRTRPELVALPPVMRAVLRVARDVLVAAVEHAVPAHAIVLPRYHQSGAIRRENVSLHLIVAVIEQVEPHIRRSADVVACDVVVPAGDEHTGERVVVDHIPRDDIARPAAGGRILGTPDIQPVTVLIARKIIVPDNVVAGLKQLHADLVLRNLHVLHCCVHVGAILIACTEENAHTEAGDLAVVNMSVLGGDAMYPVGRYRVSTGCRRYNAHIYACRGLQRVAVQIEVDVVCGDQDPRTPGIANQICRQHVVARGVEDRPAGRDEDGRIRRGCTRRHQGAEGA